MGHVLILLSILTLLLPLSASSHIQRDFTCILEGMEYMHGAPMPTANPCEMSCRCSFGRHSCEYICK